MKNMGAGMIFIMIVGLIAPIAGNVQADVKDLREACGRDALCQTLQGREFDLIKFHSMNSVLVILYESAKVGELTLFVPETDYSKERGTIGDAVDFLDGVSEVNGFSVLKGKRSIGWFKTEIIEGVYVIKPEYEAKSEYRAPDHRFSDKNGKIIMYIIPTYERYDFFDGLSRY